MMVIVANLAELLQELFNLGQFTSEILASVTIFALALLITWIGYSIFERRLIQWAEETKSKVDDAILNNIKAPIFLLAVLAGIYYGLEVLTFLTPYSMFLTQLFTVTEILVITFIIIRVVNVLTGWYAQKGLEQERRVNNHLLFILKKTIQVVVYIFAFLAILVVFNIDLSGVVLGFGIGGIAVALALQNILGDAFSAFSIYFDRPFEIGDYIVIGDYSGTVTKIGIKSTRIKLLQGEELVISNKELTAAKVRNFKRMQKRRVAFTISVTCDTPLDKLKKIPKLVSQIIEREDLAEISRVHFKEFGDFSYDFEVVYYMNTDSFSKYMDTQQEINFAIVEAFEQEGIEMPFPTQTIFLNK